MKPTMVRSTGWVCAVLLVAAAVWFVIASIDAGPARPLDANAVPASPPSPDAAGTQASLTGVLPSTNERARVEVEAAASEPPIPADAVYFDVLVLDGKTMQPIAGAEAVWGDQTQWDLVSKLPPEQATALWSHDEAAFARFGWHGRSDRDGRLRVHVGSQTQVFARAGTRYGSGYFAALGAAPPEGHRLLLHEDLTVRVHVTDAAGRDAASVPVTLDNVDADGVPEPNLGGEPTDDAGLMRFEHVQLRQVWMQGNHHGEPVAHWAACIRIPGLDIEPVLVDAQSPPVEPIEIRLPPTGRLKVKVTFEGQPIPGLRQLAFHAGPRDNDQANNRALFQRVDAEGWARFGQVPLRKTLFVLASRTLADAWNLEVTGPTVADQEVVVTLELANEVVTFVGRLLEADGTPVASQSVAALYRLPSTGGAAPVSTDAQGRFVWPVYRPGTAAKSELKLEEFFFERRSTNAPSQRASVPPRDVVVGRNELGDVRFTAGALVVGGRFVFDTPGSSRTWFQIDSARAEPGASTVQWVRVHDLQTAVQEDGTFEVRGTVEPGRYRLRVLGQDHLPVDPVEFPLGTADLRIEMRRGSPLELTCLLPPGIDPANVWLQLQPAVATPSTPATPAHDDDVLRQDPLRGQSWSSGVDTLHYKWDGLAAGTYTLLVQCPGLGDPRIRVPEVVVPLPAGGDPRLLPLDLRDAIGTLRVKVTVPAGERSFAVFAFLQPQADDSVWQGIRLDVGETVLPAPQGPVDLVIASEGLRPVTVRGARDRVDVGLEAWPAVDVHVLGLDALPADIAVRISAHDATGERPGVARFRISRVARARDSLMQPNSSAVVGKDGVAHLPVGEGVMNLTVSLSLGESGPGKSLQQVTPNQIVAGAPVTVQLDADEVRTVIAALREQAAKK